MLHVGGIEIANYKLYPYTVEGHIYGDDLSEFEMKELGYTIETLPEHIYFTADVDLVWDDEYPLPIVDRASLWGRDEGMNVKFLEVCYPRWDMDFFTELLADQFALTYAEERDENE